MKRIEIKENNLNMVYEITDENEIKLLHFSNLPFDENDINSCEAVSYTHLTLPTNSRV